ncbi:MAG TPA: ABC transporter substrate-binding protein [Conexibacter sp.]|nr:ABC transporter substrate-binding protein [Conexibacter sp.]
MAAAAAAAVLAACGGGTSAGGDTTAASGKAVDTAPASTGGTLRLARSLEPVTLNPFTCACENGSWQTMVQLFDTLVEFMPGTSDPVPGLAESWKVSSDKKTFTFHLRDASFSDGSPVTAADVKYALDRVNNPKHPYYVLYGMMKSVTTPDARTVVVRLREPTIGFLWYVGHPAASIVPKAAIERMGDEAFGRRPIGSGAFTLKRWVKGQVVELARNPHYWRKGQPYLDSVEMLYTPNDNTRTLDLLSGNVDAVDAVAFSQVDQVDHSGDARVLFQLSSGMYNVWFNERYASLAETGVRQALNYATPLEQIRRVVFGDRADVANSSLPKLKDWSEGVEPYTYDLDKARALMARSSMPDGFDLTIDFASGDETSKQVAQILQDEWSKIGVNVKLRQYDFGTLYTRVGRFDYEAFMLPPDVYTSDLPILDQFAQFLFNDPDVLHNAWTWYDNEEAARLTEQAVHASDEAEQTRLYGELQQVTLDDPPSVPLVFPPFRAAARSDVKGFQYVQTGWWRLEQVSLER